MIRRGLQFLIAVMCTLGAAPCFSQITNIHPNPEQIVLQGVTVSNVSYDGLYTKVGENSPGGTFLFQRYSTESDVTPPIVTWQSFDPQQSTNQNVGVRLHAQWPTTISSGTVLLTSFTNFSAIKFGLGEVTPISLGTGSALVTFYVSDEFRQAFPDWASAAVKIPLGFTFAMAFWAAAVALTISLKWVRDLASAAS
jgi:hypothetical protein